MENKYEVIISKEEKRRFGWRRPGKSESVGIYFMGELSDKTELCERLPWPLHVCPACGEGLRKFRSCRWINPRELFAAANYPKCTLKPPDHAHASCPVCNPRWAKALVMWAHEKFYRLPENFVDESVSKGVSMKVTNLPNGFIIGRHGVYLAHRRAFQSVTRNPAPGIFAYFEPTSVDLVISMYAWPPLKPGKTSANIPDRAKKLKDKLGDKARIVVVERIEEQ